jgi:hypothetical protein
MFELPGAPLPLCLIELNSRYSHGCGTSQMIYVYICYSYQLLCWFCHRLNYPEIPDPALIP